MTRLFQLSENCDFGTSKEEQIPDQLIDKCRSHDLRKQLLAVSGKLTLHKARDIARSIEAAESQARSIESDSGSGNVNSLEREYFDSPKRGGGRSYRCGLERHFARDPECKARLATVNSRYSGHPRDRDLVSVIARVRNSGVRENFYFKPYLQKGVICVFIFINSRTFFRPVVASKELQNFIYKQNRT